MKRIVIAAPHSGSGKTTVTLGIMAALRRRGLKVAPFKVGPDFIDPGYHALVTGAPSINLDGWMCPREFVSDSFARSTADSDIAVIEGVMGLFDGIDGSSDAGSTAQVAKELAAPVILVVDARSQARSAAALVSGFAGFDPGVRVAGVIFNNVASANHERILREALAAHLPGVAVLGCMPRDAALAIPSRHLGLTTAEDNPLSAEFLDHLVEVVERHLDLEALLNLKQQKLPALPQPEAEGGRGGAPVRIAVARDAAFCFAYPDNLRLLAEEGAEICCFSPMEDAALPDGIGGIYLPGGYPELFAAKLAGNEPMLQAVRQAVEAGVPVYAECGGFIYLTQGVAGEGETIPFVGVFPVRTRMLPRRKALGYREIELIADTVVGTKGTKARGHEFHYSEMGEMPERIERLYRVSRKGADLGLEGFRYKNCLASYIHLHFGSSPGIARDFVGHCRAYRTRSLT
ncbi:cobyrinate a,c-diamide synthase [Geomonas subterranea]|uniref:Cobyrinate a,c-diamide synthase n=1 Tax=Geomonas subterranea TaxID=2847989 RepID=A0ABX8LE10_9BACT|nr:cobyrinate a,c-diamide synthase [Geomonas subterranea]QXE90290.1 cobyrinate a,c-diamide synthase [Geomonas subterranea]QXM07585.1 cobyrinate a,c-diamide synthase [Geomonas subterranea]